MALALGRVRFAPLFGPRSAFAFGSCKRSPDAAQRRSGLRRRDRRSEHRRRRWSEGRATGIWRVSQWLCSLIQEGTGLRVPAVAGPGMTMVN